MPVYGAALPVHVEVVVHPVSTLATAVETSDGTPDEQEFAFVSYFTVEVKNSGVVPEPYAFVSEEQECDDPSEVDTVTRAPAVPHTASVYA